MKSMRHVLTISYLAMSLGACSNETKEPVEQPSKAELESRARAKVAVDEAVARRVPTTTVGMNCRDHDWNYENSISSYAVEEVWYGQITKKFVGAGGLGCGGTLHVGYQLPTKWQPHMKVLVRWTPKWAGDEYTIERYTTIPYYTEPGEVTVHFFSKDRVRVVISNIGPEGPEHPIAPNATEPPPEIDGEFEQPPNAPNPPPPPQRVR
jgi:hypothetical protein